MKHILIVTLVLAALCVQGKLITRYNDNAGHTYFVVQVKRSVADKTSQTMKPTPAHKPEVVLCVKKSERGR